jgi:hypothetical protein
VPRLNVCLDVFGHERLRAHRRGSGRAGLLLYTPCLSGRPAGRALKCQELTLSQPGGLRDARPGSLQIVLFLGGMSEGGRWLGSQVRGGTCTGLVAALVLSSLLQAGLGEDCGEGVLCVQVAATDT